MHFGFSYVGLIFILMLMVPNLIWTKNQPKDYEKYTKMKIKFWQFLNELEKLWSVGFF